MVSNPSWSWNFSVDSISLSPLTSLTITRLSGVKKHHKCTELQSHRMAKISFLLLSSDRLVQNCMTLSLTMVFTLNSNILHYTSKRTYQASDMHNRSSAWQTTSQRPHDPVGIRALRH